MRPTSRNVLALLLGGALFGGSLLACGDDGNGGSSEPAVDTGAETDATDDSGVEADVPIEVPPAPEGTRALFDTRVLDDADNRFYDFPWPSDLRVDADGSIALSGIPNPTNQNLFTGVIEVADMNPGFPMQPVFWQRFNAEMPVGNADVLVPASTTESVLLVELSEGEHRGELFPVVWQSVPEDPYTPSRLLGFAPRPGIVLRPDTTYAFVVMRSFGDASGTELGVVPAIWEMAHGATPSGAHGESMATTYAPLWDVLDDLGVDPLGVATATVFSTWDPVAELYEMSEDVRSRYAQEIDVLGVDPDDGADHDRFCELLAEIELPQFQSGEVPFNTDGLFAFDDNGALVEQRMETIPFVITLPNEEMPEEGWPLVVYYHGSGGISSQVVDRGYAPPGQGNTPGEGPAYVLAAHGFASVGAALPVNPERYVGANGFSYINLTNLRSFPYTFRQGVIEQRLLLDSLLDLQIDPDSTVGCDGLGLPGGASGHFFNPEPVMAMGQSMGGMYANMIVPVEPRIHATVPTGAGGFWSWFILETQLIPGARGLLGTILGTEAELSFLHPVLHTMQMAWEPAEPMIYMPRIARRPLEGHPQRSVYNPAGYGDSYFPPSVYDAASLAYGHTQAGDEVWPEMQPVLALQGLDGIESYDVVNNVTNEITGDAYTGVVVQYAGDHDDPHNIFVQLDEVKYQYGCFFESYFRTGTAVLPDPQPLGTPCPLSE